MFYFIIPRTPVKLRNMLREELWQISKTSLLTQTSKNWKAIIVGDTASDELNTEHFVTLDHDDYTKREKIEIALKYLKTQPSVGFSYLIRFDDDDIFSRDILQEIEAMPVKYDCYFDPFHTYIDLVYLKLSQKKNTWMANTAIHKYEHAITVCGKLNQPLLIQDHSDYWHIYYADKNTYKTSVKKPLYFRIITPFSITSSGSQSNGLVDWHRHLLYLRGYGPWKDLPKELIFYKSLSALSDTWFSDKPQRSRWHWFVNNIKWLKNKLSA